MDAHRPKAVEVGSTTVCRHIRPTCNTPGTESAGIGQAHPEVPQSKPKPLLLGVARIVCFFVLIAALATALDAIITLGLRRIQTSKFGSLNKVFSGRVNAEIIINGSSRALTHYDPKIIEEFTGRSAYNLGMNGVQIDVQLAMLKSYLNNNSKPKLVVQNLESFTFEPTRVGELYDPAAYVPYLGNNELYRALLAIDPAAWKWKHIPLYGYTVEDMKFTWVWGLLGCLGINSREDYYRGFAPRHIEWTGDFERFKEAISDGVTYRIEPRGVESLREIMNTCKAKGIDLVLVCGIL